ncbi:MAG: hypothetical protein ABJJ69_03785 [Paracoccaceae bacterium]
MNPFRSDGDELTYYARLPLVATLLLLGFPCLAEEAVIGEFALEVDTKAITLKSYYIAEDDFSDLSFQESSGIKSYFVSASADEGLPLVDVVLQEGSVAGALSIVSVTFIDQNYDTALAASALTAGGVALDGLGVIMDDLVELDDDGALNFSFNVELVRIDLDSDTPIAGADGAHIAASFAGRFPTSTLNE